MGKTRSGAPTMMAAESKKRSGVPTMMADNNPSKEDYLAKGEENMSKLGEKYAESGKGESVEENLMKGRSETLQALADEDVVEEVSVEDRFKDLGKRIGLKKEFQSSWPRTIGRRPCPRLWIRAKENLWTPRTSKLMKEADSKK